MHATLTNLMHTTNVFSGHRRAVRAQLAEMADKEALALVAARTAEQAAPAFDWDAALVVMVAEGFAARV